MADTSDGNDIPNQCEIFGFREALTHDGDRDFRPSWPSQSFHTIQEGEIFGRFSCDLNDLVPGHDPGLEGWSAFDGRDDGEDSIFQGDLDSQTLESTLCLLLHLLKHGRRHVRGM